MRKLMQYSYGGNTLKKILIISACIIGFLFLLPILLFILFLSFNMGSNEMHFDADKQCLKGERKLSLLMIEDTVTGVYHTIDLRSEEYGRTLSVQKFLKIKDVNDPFADSISFIRPNCVYKVSNASNGDAGIYNIYLRTDSVCTFSEISLAN